MQQFSQIISQYRNITLEWHTYCISDFLTDTSFDAFACFLGVFFGLSCTYIYVCVVKYRTAHKARDVIVSSEPIHEMLRHPQSELSYRLILIDVTHQPTDMMNLHGLKFCNKRNSCLQCHVVKMFYDESGISRTDITGNLKNELPQGRRLTTCFVMLSTVHFT